jgi:hypothetical protein
MVSPINSQQCIVFLLLVRPEGDPVDVLRFGRQLEVNKLHILLSTETDVNHERLQKSLTTSISNTQRSGNDCVEDISLLNATRDVQELEQRMEILDIVDAKKRC